MSSKKNSIIFFVLVIVIVVTYRLASWVPEGEGSPEELKRLKAGKAEEKTLTVMPAPQKKVAEAKDEYELEKIPREEEIFMKGERMLHFDSKEAMDEFLRRAADKGFTIVKTIRGINMVRIRFDRRIGMESFKAEFGEVSQISENASVNVPEPILATGAQGFNSHPLNFLGIDNNKGWGKNVTVAVIDSGVVAHNSLQGNISHIDLIGDDSAITSHHGTAVASLIAGDTSLIQGVAPATNILDIRALSNDGSGDAFTVAEAIVAAVENGAAVINLSLGTPSDNAALREAVNYAQNNGVIIVAAVGNEGAGQVSYPAAYEGVIGVGANDANENYLSFSNRGDEVDITAPGLQLTAAGLNNDTILFSGTSAASPLVAATLAYQISQNPDLTTEQLINQLVSNANETGPPGNDSLYGEGVLNVGRIEDNTSSSVTDAAAGGFFLDPIPGSDNLKLSFSGENRGTEILGTVKMTLSYPGFTQTYEFSNIESSQIFYESIEIPTSSDLIQQQQEIVLSIQYPSSEATTSNNTKSVRIRLNTAQETPE